MKHEPKILMIVNEFPPVGESGVQRPLKFLKYLSKAGCETFVITPKRLPKNVIDRSLEKDVPPEAKIFHTGSWGLQGGATESLGDFRSKLSRGGSGLRSLLWLLLKLVNDILFPIDKQIGWVPFAWFKAVLLIRKHRIRNVYITAYPFSAFFVGVLLKLTFGKRIFWLADYRDAWQFEPKFEEKTLWFRQRIIIACDNLFLKIADYVVFPTDYIRDDYITAYPYLTSKSLVITNGYDEDDFSDIKAHTFPKFTFLYMGKVYPEERNPIPMLKVMKEVMDIDFQYVHIGTIGKEIHRDIQEQGYDFYAFEGYKDHHTAISYACAADINVILVQDDAASEGVYTGKLFELLRVGKPILAFGPRRSIIEKVFDQTELGFYAPISSPQKMKEAIVKAVQMSKDTHNPKPNIQSFSRQCTADQLMSIYTKAVTCD